MVYFLVFVYLVITLLLKTSCLVSANVVSQWSFGSNFTSISLNLMRHCRLNQVTLWTIRNSTTGSLYLTIRFNTANTVARYSPATKFPSKKIGALRS